MKNTKQNEGVALIVVLGFLSLMLVLAVAFLGEARTERMVSDYSLEAIRARQLMRTALAAAQNDYSHCLWTNKTVLPDANLDVFISLASGVNAISGTQGTLGGSGVIITNGEIMEWVPARYKTKAVMDDMEDAEWILVREEPGKNSRILGRYAYICLDSSGGLDANWVASLGSREVKGQDRRPLLADHVHHSVMEVPMGLLPEVEDADKFYDLRSGWQGFDSLQTLVKLTDGEPNDGSESPSNARWDISRKEYKGQAALDSNSVSDLVSYSLTAYRGGRYDRGNGKWTLPIFMDQSSKPLPTFKDLNTGKPVGLKDFLRPFLENNEKQKAQLLEENLDDIQKQLQDYLSSDIPPIGVDYPSIKAVPMFNELWVERIKLNPNPELRGSNYVYTAEVQVGVETWFPFPAKNNNKGQSFTLEAPQVSLQSSAGSSGIWIPVALQVSSEKGDVIQQVKQTDCKPDPESVSVSGECQVENGMPKPVVNTFTYTVEFEGAAKPVTDPKAKLVWQVGWEVRDDSIQLKYGSKPVDQIAKGVKFAISGRRIFEQGDASDAFSMEVVDPRLNHIKDQWQKANYDKGTPGKINDVVEQDNPLSPFNKEGPWMYCQNSNMLSAAEFGYFSTGESWQTLNLCSPHGTNFLALTLLDKVVKDDLEAKGVHYTNATININTYRTNVLASAFYGLSFMPTPNTEAEQIGKQKSQMQFSEGQARNIARLIQATTATNGSYHSGMDWANSSAMTNYLPAVLTQTERESVLRNTDGLFSVSDSLFTVILIAQSIKEGPGNVGKWDDEDQVTGERRGVALVWRDPYKTGNNLHHEMMVRMFRFLND